MSIEHKGKEGAHVGKVVLGQHGMSRVGGLVIVKDDMLLVVARLNDLVGAGAQFVLDLADDWHNEGCNQREHKDRKLVLELLNDLGQDGDLLDLLRDLLDNLIVELNRRHYLLEDVLDVQGILLRVPRRDGRLLHLRRVCVALQLLHLALLVVAAKQARGDLVEQVAQDAGVPLRALLQRALKLLNFVLGQLVGHFAGDRVQKVHAAKGASDDGVDFVAGALEAHACVATNVGKDIALAHLDEGKFAVVAVSQEIWRNKC